MLSMVPILRRERARFFEMADAYMREQRPADDRLINDPVALMAYLESDFWSQHDDRHLWWFKRRETIVGFAKTERPEDPVWERMGYVADFHVLPAFRRQGYGTAFAQLILDRFADQGIRYVRLHVRVDDPRALAFWQKAGFETVRYQMRRFLEPQGAAPRQDPLTHDTNDPATSAVP